MFEIANQDLSDVSETLLMTLYIRAMESQRPDALIKDEKDKVTVILRNLEFDRYTRDFLRRRPEAAVVHIGCGLDSRFERVDNGQMEWYDLDLPEVIALRRKFIGDEGKRYHLLGGSAFDSVWIDQVSAHRQRPFLFLAEGVFMYFEGAQIKSLALTLRDRFPGAELVFDAYSPFLVRANNLRLSIAKFGARYHWGIRRGQELEGWGDGIHLLDEWGYFDRPEPRLDHIRWMRHIPLLARVLRIYHYRLGEAAG